MFEDTARSVVYNSSGQITGTEKKSFDDAQILLIMTRYHFSFLHLAISIQEVLCSESEIQDWNVSEGIYNAYFPYKTSIFMLINISKLITIRLCDKFLCKIYTTADSDCV
jgi:hypothetical protein